MASWTPAEMPDLKGRVAIVTGASSGIGEAAAFSLAAKGASVILAVRNQAKGEATLARLRASQPSADVKISIVDMADLASIRSFSARTLDAQPQIDILLNNAGLGMQPARAVTVDGFERQFATNHLGQFALTGLLLPGLLRAPSARVVAISSIAHRRGAIDFDDLQGASRYGGLKAYGQSKLANLLFAFELDRRSEAAGFSLVSVAAHPGVSNTGFMAAVGLPKPITMLTNVAMRVIAQGADRGSLPGLYAATMPNVQGGQYFGPNGAGELRGSPVPAAISVQARDEAVALRLWSESERLTGVTYGALDRPRAA